NTGNIIHYYFGLPFNTSKCFYIYFIDYIFDYGSLFICRMPNNKFGPWPILLVSKPTDHGIYFLGFLRLIVFTHDHITPANVYIIFQSNNDGHWGESFIKLNITLVNRFNGGRESGWEHNNFITVSKNT